MIMMSIGRQEAQHEDVSLLGSQSTTQARCCADCADKDVIDQRPQTRGLGVDMAPVSAETNTGLSLQSVQGDLVVGTVDCLHTRKLA